MKRRAGFPEEVAYLLETDLISAEKRERLLSALRERLLEKRTLAVSAKDGTGLDGWLEILPC